MRKLAGLAGEKPINHSLCWGSPAYYAWRVAGKNYKAGIFE